MVECNNHKWTHTIASWTCCLFVCMCSCIYYKLQYVLLYIHTSISLNNKIINESKISCINYKEIYKRNWIGIDLFWIGIGIGIDKFDVELELELTKWNWVELELELELTKWNWPHVWWKSNFFQRIDNDPIGVLYEFQIDISTNSREIKYQNMGIGLLHVKRHTRHQIWHTDREYE